MDDIIRRAAQALLAGEQPDDFDDLIALQAPEYRILRAIFTDPDE